MVATQAVEDEAERAGLAAQPAAIKWQVDIVILAADLEVVLARH